MWSVDELETLTAGTKPRHCTIECLGRRELWSKKALNSLLEWMKEGHCQSDEHWNCFKCSIGKVLRDGVWCIYVLFQAHKYHLELNWIQLSVKLPRWGLVHPTKTSVWYAVHWLLFAEQVYDYQWQLNVVAMVQICASSCTLKSKTITIKPSLYQIYHHNNVDQHTWSHNLLVQSIHM